MPLEYKNEKYLLKRDDLLFCHTNSSKLVGKNAIFDLEGDYAYSNHLTRLRTSGVTLPKWLWYVLSIYWKEGNFEKKCKHWVNQSTLPQEEIVRRVEPLFKFADEVEERVEEARNRVEKINQSILSKAFKGELTEDFREAVRNWGNLSLEERRKYHLTLPEGKQKIALYSNEFPLEPAFYCNVFGKAKQNRGEKLRKESKLGNWSYGLDEQIRKSRKTPLLGS